MRKIELFAVALAVCGALLSLNSCEKDKGIEIDDDPTGEIKPEPTTDRMDVLVTADLPAAVLSNFDGNSTGAAFTRRLGASSPAITENTRLVFVEGSDMMKWDDAAFDQVAEVVRNGGYLAIETLTGREMEWFAERLIERQSVWEQAYIAEKYEFADGSQAGASSFASRWNARTRTIRDMGTRAGAVLDDSVVAEMVAFSNVAYFYLPPFRTEVTATIGSIDAEDNLLDSNTVTVKMERTPYRAGQMADGLAEWLNRVEKERTEGTRAVGPSTRAGLSSINELMSADDRFSIAADLCFRTKHNVFCPLYNRVLLDFYLWGVHNLETRTDYYYVQEKIRLSMGEDNGWYGIYSTCVRDTQWDVATGFGEHNRYYGAFLSQYENTLSIKGPGTVKMVEALPYTDNTSGSKSILVGSSSGTSQSLGVSFNASFSAKPGFNLGGSYSYGWSESNSFTLNTAQTYKDLGVSKSTAGDTKVTWTYKANKPTFYIKEDKDYIYFCHTQVPDILVNVVDLQHEAIWSVANPQGPSTVDVASKVQTAALLFIVYPNTKEVKERGTDKYEYADTPVVTSSHTLMEPGRARQLWRMEVIVDKKYPDAPYSARKSIEEDLREHFPSCYKQEFEVCDMTPTSVGVIDAVINASREVFDAHLSELKQYASEVGVLQYTIRWRCDEEGISSKQGYVVRAY